MGLGGPSIDGGKVTLNISGWWLKHMRKSNWILSLTHWWDLFLVIFVDWLVVFLPTHLKHMRKSKLAIHLPQRYRGENSPPTKKMSCHPLDLVRLVRKPLMNMFIHKIPTGLSFDQRLRKSCEITCDVIWTKKCKCKHSQSPWQLYICNYLIR